MLVEQLGIPLPATPVLLAAGALSAEGQISFPLALLPWRGCVADRRQLLVLRRAQAGHHVLRLLCKLSLEPTTCVRRTQDSFGRRRGIMLMFAKFVPGLATLAPPVAGQNGMSYRPFLFFDTIGASALGWRHCWPSAVSSAICSSATRSFSTGLGRFSGALLILGIVGFFIGRLFRRRMVLKELAASRLEPEELNSSSTPASRSILSTCAIPSSCCPTRSRCPARCIFRPTRSPRAT